MESKSPFFPTVIESPSSYYVELTSKNPDKTEFEFGNFDWPNGRGAMNKKKSGTSPDFVSEEITLFYEELEEKMAILGANNQDCLVFIHGYLSNYRVLINSAVNRYRNEVV